MGKYYYSVGGSLNPNHPTYVIRKADQELLELLKQREYCFVFNSRQMGKSSLRLQTRKKLRADGIKCAAVDITLMGSYITSLQWYQGLMAMLLNSFDLDTELDLNQWYQQYNYLAEVQLLDKFIVSVILEKIPENIVIFIDEIDSILNTTFKEDFFAYLRACYNQRAEENSPYNRLTFCLLGVATPADLITDKSKTPFNIGHSIELTGLTFIEAKEALIAGFEDRFTNPEAILAEVLNWTGGQPFLTQKLCRILMEKTEEESHTVEEIVNQYILQNWESQDQPEHLKTIRDRLIINEHKAIHLLGLYQQILASNSIKFDGNKSQIELRLSGLVVKKDDDLMVYNPIYRAIFNNDWLNYQMARLRPYSEVINNWVKANRDSSNLLQGETLKEAQNWAKDKQLSELDYQFLAASQAHQDQQTNKILADANKKAQRMIHRGSLILSATSFLAIFLAVIGSLYLGEQLRIFKETIEVEKSGVNALKQFDSNQIDGLLSAMQATQNLKSLVKNERSLANYPTTSPISALLNILNQISEQNQLEGHQKPVKSISFSPDGTMIASGSIDGTIKLWKRDGKWIKTLTHGGEISSVSFSHDGKIIAAGGKNGKIKLWQLDGRLVNTITNDALVYNISFSPDDQAIAYSSYSDNVNIIKIWNQNGKVIPSFKGHQDSIYAVSFSPDGKIIASGSEDNTIKLWKLDGTLIKSITVPKSPVYAISFSPDGKMIASGDKDKKVKLWNLDGTLIKTLTGHSRKVNTVAFSPDGKMIASGSEDNTIKLWKQDGTPIKTLTGHKDSVWSISYNPDGKMIASGSLDNTIKIWNLKDSQITHIAAANDSWITSVSYSPDGKMIASGNAEKTIKLWKADGTAFKTINDDNSLIDVTFSPEGKTLAAIANDGMTDGMIKLWQDGRLVKTIPESKSNCISYSPDGKTFASGNRDYTVKIWKNDGTLIKTLTGHKREVRSISYSPDGKTIASGGFDGTIKLWKSDGTLIRTLIGHDAEITQISFSVDGKIFASSSKDGTVKIWKDDGKIITLPEHNSVVTSVRFNPDGKTLASSDIDGKINLWKSDGKLMFTLNAGNEVTSISFSPDGQSLVAGSKNGSLILWSLNPDDLITRSCTWLKDYLSSHPKSIASLRICQHGTL